MACVALFPISPPRLCVRLYFHRSAPSSCQQQLRGGLSCSSARQSNFSCKDSRKDGRRTVRGDYNDGDIAFSTFSRSPKSSIIAATNLAESITSSYTEVTVENKCRPTSKLRREYIAREADLDEELWAAAWIRAESYCDELPYVRYIESYKKKFAEQEFDALKRRLLGKYGHSVKCICLVAVDAQCSQNCTMTGAGKATILDRVVGTLDLSVRLLSQGEAFPGDSIRATLSVGALDVRGSQRYGYIANVCVTKAARRNGIASSLLQKAIKAAKDWGLKELFVHVNSNNKAARHLYDKFNFQNLQAGAVQLGVQNVILLQLLL